jgi:hypothetical protein
MKLKGNWANNVAYDVGDVVKYTDDHVYHLQNPAKAGTDCHNTLYWQRIEQPLEECVLMILDGVTMAEDGALDGKVANNLTTTASGKVLDARQGKALKTLVDGVAEDLGEVNPDAKTLVLASSTASSTKKFSITVDDEGELTATEIVAAGT